VFKFQASRSLRTSRSGSAPSPTTHRLENTVSLSTSRAEREMFPAFIRYRSSVRRTFQ